jgi:hypothetical protein
MQWNRRRSTNPACTGCIGTMSALIGIRLSARTMAGAHITEARPPIKMRLRVGIEPPSNHLSEGKCPITTEWLFLSRKSSSWCLIGARLGGERTKRRRDSTRGQGASTRTTLGRKPRRLSGPRNRRRPADNRRRRIASLRLQLFQLTYCSYLLVAPNPKI